MSVEDLEQAERIINGESGDEYTLNEADVEGCRNLLRKLLDTDKQTGGYRVTSVQGYPSGAQVMIKFDKTPGAMVCARAAEMQIDGVDKLGLLLKKVIAHWNTNGDRLAKLEEFVKVYDHVRELPGDSPVDIADYSSRIKMLDAAREALG